MRSAFCVRHAHSACRTRDARDTTSRVLRAMVVVGTALLGVALVATIGHRPQPDKAPTATMDQLSSRFAAAPGTTPADRVARLQDRLRTRPEDWSAWAALGSAYVDHGRINGDPSVYPKAEGALTKSLALRPDGNGAALTGMAALANARHDFAAALSWSEKATALDPDQAAPLGPLGDALVELGRYDEGFDAFQRMIDIEPSLASYARVSYARELQGDVAGAAAALEAAARVGSRRSDQAFAYFQLGELRWNAGRTDEAIAAYRRASGLDPDFLAPQAAMARAMWAQGRPDDAAAAYERLVARLPVPQYVTELADLYVVTGQPEKAQEQFAVLDTQARLLVANGVNVDLEVSLFSADHGIRLEDGLAAARSEWERRKSVFVADALAWQLHANGRDEEALGFADQALRLGTTNALFHYHRSRIRLALGQRDAAREDLQRALDINPHFSILHAGPAADLQQRLQAGIEPETRR